MPATQQTTPTASPDAQNSGDTRPLAPVTIRAVLLGLFGGASCAILQQVSSVIPNSAALNVGSTTSLFAGPILWLFLLAIVNIILRRWLPRFAIRPAEFAVIYGLSTVAAAISEHDEVEYLVPMFVSPFRHDPLNAMAAFRHFIPTWLVPHDPRITQPYYLGNTSFWQPRFLKAWAVPLTSWMVYLMALGVTMWSWNVIVRRRWIEHDRLSFPCVQLPLEICREAGFGGMVGGKLFWGGLIVSLFLESLAQLHTYFPTIPGITFFYDASTLTSNFPPPWNALSPMILWSNTFFFGVCYMVPTDILFSSWFFYIARKLLEVFGYAHGWRDLAWDSNGFPYTRSQAAGAWAALFFLLIWAERHHFWRVLKSAFSKDVQLDDANEPGSYRWAGRLLICGILIQIAFLSAAGMSLELSVLYTAFFWILYITMTRVYAQVGPPILEMFYLDPQWTLSTALGTNTQSPGSLTIFSMMYWINRTHRGQPMSHILSAFYVAGETRVRMRSFGKWVLVAFGVGCIACLLTELHWAYRIGEMQFGSGGWAESGGGMASARLTQWVNSPKGPQWAQIGFMAIGAAITLALAAINNTFIGTPFHPIGYALAVSYALEYDWPAFLGIWILKSLILRYGGGGLYRRFVPFFLGLTLGGLLTPVGWQFLSWLFEWYRR